MGFFYWCLRAELNHGHRDFQSLALPTELRRHEIYSIIIYDKTTPVNDI